MRTMMFLVALLLGLSLHAESALSAKECDALYEKCAAIADDAKSDACMSEFDAKCVNVNANQGTEEVVVVQQEEVVEVAAPAEK
jgi:hypothetical protein